MLLSFVYVKIYKFKFVKEEVQSYKNGFRKKIKQKPLHLQGFL